MYSTWVCFRVTFCIFYHGVYQPSPRNGKEKTSEANLRVFNFKFKMLVFTRCCTYSKRYMLYKSKIGFKGHNIGVLDESPDLVFLGWFFTDSTMVFISITHHHLGGYVFYFFQANLRKSKGRKVTTELVKRTWVGTRDHHNETPPNPWKGWVALA